MVLIHSTIPFSFCYEFGNSFCVDDLNKTLLVDWERSMWGVNAFENGFNKECIMIMKVCFGAGPINSRNVFDFDCNDRCGIFLNWYSFDFFFFVCGSWYCFLWTGSFYWFFSFDMVTIFRQVMVITLLTFFFCLLLKIGIT